MFLVSQFPGSDFFVIDGQVNVTMRALMIAALRYLNRPADGDAVTDR